MRLIVSAALDCMGAKLRKRNWIVPASSVLATLISTTAASAAPPGMWSNFYVSVFGGPAMGVGSVSAHGFDPECGPSDPEFCVMDMTGTVGSGFLGGAAVGTTLAPNTRAELEFSLANLATSTTTSVFDPEHSTTAGGPNSGSLMSTFMFGNIWYDIPISPQLTGYLGGGAGFAHGSGTFNAPITTPLTSDMSLSVNGFAPAVQVGGGVSFAVTPTVTIDFGYRFKEAFGLPVTTAPSFISTQLDGIDEVSQAGTRRDRDDPRAGQLDERDRVVVDEPSRAGLDVGRVLAVGQGRQVDAMGLADAELGHGADPAGDAVAGSRGRGWPAPGRDRRRAGA